MGPCLFVSHVILSLSGFLLLHSCSYSTGGGIMCAVNRSAIYILLFIQFHLCDLMRTLHGLIVSGSSSATKLSKKLNQIVKALATILPISLLVISYVGMDGFFVCLHERTQNVSLLDVIYTLLCSWRQYRGKPQPQAQCDKVASVEEGRLCGLPGAEQFSRKGNSLNNHPPTPHPTFLDRMHAFSCSMRFVNLKLSFFLHERVWSWCSLTPRFSDMGTEWGKPIFHFPSPLQSFFVVVPGVTCFPLPHAI